MSDNFSSDKNFPVPKSAVACALAAVSLFLFSSCAIFQTSPNGPLSQDRTRGSGHSLENRGSASGNSPYWYRNSRLFPLKTPAGNDSSHPDDEGGRFSALPEILGDDMDLNSLEQVILNQLAAMPWTGNEQEIQLGELTTTRGWLRETLLSFLRLIRLDLSAEELSRRIQEDFIFYKAGKEKNKRMLFTGYYAPVIEASPVATGEYQYPLYQKPLDPPDFAGSMNPEARQVGFPPKTIRTWKDYTREDIDGQGILNDKNLEIAWLKDDLDRYFLHIQGSGLLKFSDGATKVVRYDGSNKYSYRGVGKVMIEDGAIPIEEGSMQGIKRYLREHPEDVRKYFFRNKRYIFFKLSDQGPHGSGGGELVGGRSIATDKSVYPAGGLGFLQLKKPVLNDKEEIVEWKSFSRFVVDQDTGSAIRGPGRGDLYFGMGHLAGVKAGQFHVRGNLYYLLKKANE
ncbi:MAG: MltA domain-containing protein [Nitrospinaceae bacterium]